MDLIKASKKEKVTRKKGGVKWGLLFIPALLLIIIAFSGFVIFRLYYPQDRNNSELHEFVIKEGESASTVVSRLSEEGIVVSKDFLKAFLLLTGKSDLIKSGNYELSSNAGLLEISEIITGGVVSREGKVVVVEGFSNVEVAELFADFHATYSASGGSYEVLKNDYQEKFLAEASNIEKYRSEYKFLSDVPNDGTLEGYLFPDTYRLYKDVLPEDVVYKMLDNFEQKVNDNILVEIESIGKSMFEIITLASIVEKEVSDSSHMAMVAGVYYNRLEVGRKLESDTTINYITGKNNPQPLYEDLASDSLYNTYLHEGLPPGPISNPGLKAIKATINPFEHDYFFFITRLDTGEPIFSKTGKEHLQNQEQYLK